MKTHQAYRYELKPNNNQRTLLAQHVGTARFAWNWALARRIERFENNDGKDKFTNAVKDHKEWNVWKQENAPWAYEVSKCAPQEAFRNLDRAFTSFWQRRKAGRTVGFPKFKKKGCHDTARFHGTVKCFPRAVQLPRLGRIRTKEQTHLKGRVLSATVTREADRWYASFAVERDRPDPKPIDGSVVGIDLGIKSFATVSGESEPIVAPKPLEKSLKRLRRLQKKHARKVKGSNNRRKSAKRLTRLHRKIRNRRRDFLHKTSTRLAKTKSTIVVEDLNVKKMSTSAKGSKQNPGKHVRTKARLNRSILDQGWSEFRRMLEYKTVWYGSTLVVAPMYFPSSKACSCCGHLLDELDISVRHWTCPMCNATHDRDCNAATNLERFATASSAGSYACGECSDGEVVVAASSHHSPKQEGNPACSLGICG